jgi:glycosyltransferase involved in cell wall biosynthesis
MSRPLRALVLSPEAPYPVHGGGQLRTASILEYLRKRYAVHIVTFREPGAPEPQFPPDMRGHVVELPYHAKGTSARVMRNVGRALRGVPPLVDRFSGFEDALTRTIPGQHFDVGIIEHFWCAPYWPVLRPLCDRLIVDLVDVDSVLLERQARGTKAPLFQRFADSCRRLEREWLPKFDGVLVTSPADAAYIDVPSVVYPNTIPFVPLPQVEKQDYIAFSGNMEYEPNTTGVRWFHREVWPQLRHRVRWKLIGRNEHAIRDIVAGDDRITMTGPVEDAISELAASKAAVVPILAGSGTRVKIIEAWAAGVPVISTSIGAEGLPAHAMLIADDADEFARAVHSVLDSEQLGNRLGDAGRRLYEERFTWEAAWSTLKDWGL